MQELFFALSLVSTNGQASTLYACPSKSGRHVFGPLKKAFKFETSVDAINFKNGFHTLRGAQYKVFVVPVSQKSPGEWDLIAWC